MEIIYRLDGAIVPKARPRVTARRTFMPKNYADWKENAIAAFRLQHIGSAIADTKTKHNQSNSHLLYV